MKDVRCYTCGKRITGKYYTDWAGHCVCESHFATLAKCSVCGVFCDKHAKDIGMGMKVCTHCQQYRVEQSDAKEIITYIQSLYEKTPLGKISGWTLKMVDVSTLFKMCKDRKARGLAQAIGEKYTIFIWRELSQIAFAQVVAHEMLHIYQYMQHISSSASKCEGFCNLGSYFVLSSIKSPERDSEVQAAIQCLLKDPSPIYGDGFREVLTEYQKGGWEAAIKHIST